MSDTERLELEEFDPVQRSATLRKIMHTLTPLRESQLRNIARCPVKPEKPEPGRCCGSSCDPCIMTLYAQELRIWKECRKENHPAREIEVAQVTESATQIPTADEPVAKSIASEVRRLWSW